MNVSSENILLVGSVLLFISIIASRTSFKFGVPALLLFLVVGMLAGSDGPGGIYFDDPKSAQFLGVVALTFILFSGGLETKYESIRPVLKDGISLATVGVFVTAILVGLFSSWILDFTPAEGLLVGAIVSSTDAAAVFSILRTRNVGLKGNIRPLLEFESGSNDAMAFFLTITFITVVQEPDHTLMAFIPKFIKGMTLGAICGYAMGRLMIFILNRIHLDVEGLYPVLVLSMVFFTFSLTDTLGGNGFLAVYGSAIVLGNGYFVHKKSLMKFFDGQAWIMQIIMFLTLGLLVFPKQIPPIIPQGIAISAFLIFIARPVSVFISLGFAKDMNYRNKLFISWVGLRGAAPIVFATYPLLANVHYADTIFNLVFFISVSSVLLQGATLPWMARILHVSVPEKVRRKFPLDIEMKDDSRSELVELDIAENSPAAGQAIVKLNLPRTSMVVLIHRRDKYLTPTGETVIEAGDHLLVMADNMDTVHKVNERFGVKETTHHG